MAPEHVFFRVNGEPHLSVDASTCKKESGVDYLRILVVRASVVRVQAIGVIGIEVVKSQNKDLVA